MKKAILFLILLVFCSLAFSQQPEGPVFYYDDSGKVEIDRDWAAYLIPPILNNNLDGSLSSLAFQSSRTGKYFFDPVTKKTVLLNVSEGSVYRIIKNENEFSPYWIGIKDISKYESAREGTSRPTEVEVSIGFIPKMFSVWYLDSKEFPFVEFDCNPGALYDAALELSVEEKKSCSNEELYGNTVTVELVSVNEDNTVSLEVEFEESQDYKILIPEAKRTAQRSFSFEADTELGSAFKNKLEGFPLFVKYYGGELLGKPSIEFYFVPNLESFGLEHTYIDKDYILAPNSLKSEEIGGGMLEVSFSLYEPFVRYIEKPAVQETPLRPEEEGLLEVFVNNEIFDYLKEGKIIGLAFNEKGKGFPLSLNEGKKTLEGMVPKGIYYLNLRPKDSMFKEWVSENFLVELNPTLKKFSKEIVVKRDTVTVTVEMSKELIAALDSAGVTPKVEIEGKEIEVPFTTVDSDTTSYREWFFPTPVGADTGITIPKIPGTTKAWVWGEEVFEDTTAKVPPEIVEEGAEITPKEKFEVTFLIGKENYNLLEQEEFTEVIKMQVLKGNKHSYIISEDKVNRDRFKVENLVKGNSYNLIISKPDKLYFNYLYPTKFKSEFEPPRHPIDQQFDGLVIDLRNERFALSDSFLLEAPLKSIQEEIFNWSKVPLAETGFENLQIASVDVNGKKYYVEKKEGVPAHIVYLPKGTETLEIELEGYSDRNTFFYVGKPVSVPPLKTNAPNQANIGLIDESKPVLSMGKLNAGVIFSIENYSGQNIVIEGWDGTPFHVYVCQDKTEDGKCDLWFDAAKNQRGGATFVEPNYEAASIEVRLEPETPKGKARVEVGIPESVDICPLDFLEMEIDYCDIPVEIKEKIAEEVEKKVCTTGKFECTIIGNNVTINLDIGEVNLNIGKIEFKIDNVIYTTSPVSKKVELKEGETKKISLKVKAEKKGEIRYERFGEKPSTDCIAAMENAEKYHSFIVSHSSEFDPNLIRAVIQAESFPPWDPEGTGDGGTSLGLMQISEDNLKNLIGSDWEEKWMDPEENIKAGTKFLKEKETEVNNLGCKKEELDKVLPASGEAKATWRNALTIALYNGRPGIATCTEIKDNNNPDKPTFTRETHVPKVLAWYRVFAENYGKKADLGDDYCKPTTTETGTIIKPPPKVVACDKCNSIQECLACVDFKFVSGIFETSN